MECSNEHSSRKYRLPGIHSTVRPRFPRLASRMSKGPRDLWHYRSLALCGRNRPGIPIEPACPIHNPPRPAACRFAHPGGHRPKGRTAKCAAALHQIHPRNQVQFEPLQNGCEMRWNGAALIAADHATGLIDQGQIVIAIEQRGLDPWTCTV